MSHDASQPDLFALADEPEPAAVPRHARRLCAGTCCECGRAHACGVCLGGEQLSIAERTDDGAPRFFAVPR